VELISPGKENEQVLSVRRYEFPSEIHEVLRIYNGNIRVYFLDTPQPYVDFEPIDKEVPEESTKAIALLRSGRLLASTVIHKLEDEYHYRKIG
jgi:hypothetical protein